MRFLKSLLLPGCLALVTACTGPTVHFDYDSKGNFSQYKTYDWQAAPKEAKARAAALGSPLVEARVKRAVEAGLQAKGFRREGGADPDFLVSVFPTYEKFTTQTRTRVGFGMGMRSYRGGGFGVGTTVVGGRQRHLVGSIVLEIEDFKTRQLVWRAVSEGALRENVRPEDSEQDVAEAVKGLLERFPPQAK